MAVKIITDAGSDLTLAQAQKLGVLFVPMTVTFGDTQYRAGVDLTNEKFYSLLAEAKELPTTSQPTPYQFEQTFTSVPANDEAVVICLSSALSGTYQSACIAADEFDNIHVFDSLNVTIGQQLLVLHALKLAEQGLTAAQIMDGLQSAKEKLRIFAAVDSLEYLIKGGRLSKTAGLAGKVLGIRPILAIDNGTLGVIAKARGVKGAITQLNGIIAQSGELDDTMPRMVGYSGTDRSNLDAYLDASRDMWGNDPMVSEIGSTIGTHTGPGLTVMAYFVK